jgi:hypothetical protein
VVVWGDWRDSPNAPASANGDHVAFHVSLLYHALLDEKQNIRLGFYAYEEVAHFLLHREGVPGDGVGTFFQELYATWAQCEHMVNTGRLPKTWLSTWPVDTDPDQLLYDVGKQLGSALAGSEPNARHLEDWLAGAEAESEAPRLVRFGQDRLKPPLDAAKVAAAYREWTQGAATNRPAS